MTSFIGSSGSLVGDGAGTGFRAGGFQPGLARCGRGTALGHPVPARSVTASTAEQEPKRGKAATNRRYGQSSPSVAGKLFCICELPESAGSA